jgi:hypothetical protein
MATISVSRDAPRVSNYPISSPHTTTRSAAQLSARSREALLGGRKIEQLLLYGICGLNQEASQCRKEDKMTAFDGREEAFESKFAHDEELRFKAAVRRDRHLAAWAAEKLGKTGQAAKDYAAELVTIALQGPDDELVFKKLRADFDRAGVAQSDHEIRREMDILMQKALADIWKVG